MDDTTAAAILSEKPAMLATYRMELGEKFIPVKNVFVPLWVKGRRWGITSSPIATIDRGRF